MVAPFNLIEGVIWAIAFGLIYTLLQPILKNMKNKQQHWAKASFALLIFVHSRVCDSFLPQQLTGFDSASIYYSRRSACPLTAFFTKVTLCQDTKIIVIWVGLLLAVFACKKWYSEALFLGSNLVLTGLFGSSSKEYLPETENQVFFI